MQTKRIKFLVIASVVAAVLIGCSSEVKTLSLSPKKLDFDVVNIAEDKSIDVVLTNKYDKLIDIISMQLTNQVDFLVITNGSLPISLEKNASVTISIQFNPSFDGAIEGSLFITHSGSSKPKELTMTGVGRAVPRIKLSEANHDFGLILNNTSLDYDFDIENFGSMELTIDNFTISGTGAAAYSITSGGTTPKMIAIGSTDTITVHFAPVITGTYPAEIQITHDAINESIPMIITLAGESVQVAPKMELDRTSPWDFGSVAKTIPSTLPIEITSNGLSDLTVNTIDFTTGAEFTLDHIEDENGNGINLPVTLGIGKKIIAFIKFEPVANTNYTDTLTIMHDGIFNPAPTDIELKGVGRDEIKTVFAYTGAAQQWTVPAGVTALVVECYGAQGGSANWSGLKDGGLGGMAKAKISVTPGSTVGVYVGGKGQQIDVSTTGGWNGGGGTNAACSGGTAGSGGGASDIRIGGSNLSDRILVGGGGGGAGLQAPGGDGGGLNGVQGYPGTGVSGYPGMGGTQTAGGAEGRSGYSLPGVLGEGGRGKGTNCGGGGGGGGWYGGGGGTSGAGGGGSSYYDAPGNTDKSTTPGVKTGDGEIVIAY